jgi:hypothetical protein
MTATATAYPPYVGKCERCGLQVTKRWSTGLRAFVFDQHEAPCGLRCQAQPGHFIDVHQGPGRCPSCPAPPPRRSRSRRRRPAYRRLP